jgi:hypothetical protein
MLWHPKVVLDRALHARAAERAQKLGFPSVDAYIADLLERDLKVADEQKLRDTVMDKMKGLGYLQ